MGEFYALVEDLISLHSFHSSHLVVNYGIQGGISLIGVSVSIRMRCSILFVGPRTCSNTASSFARNSCSFASGVRAVTGHAVDEAFRSGGGSVKLKRAYKSIPISIGLSRIGRI